MSLFSSGLSPYTQRAGFFTKTREVKQDAVESFKKDIDRYKDNPQQLGVFFEKLGQKMSKWNADTQKTFLEALFDDAPAKEAFTKGLNKCLILPAKSMYAPDSEKPYEKANAFLTQLGISYDVGVHPRGATENIKHTITRNDEGQYELESQPPTDAGKAAHQGLGFGPSTFNPTLAGRGGGENTMRNTLFEGTTSESGQATTPYDNVTPENDPREGSINAAGDFTYTSGELWPVKSFKKGIGDCKGNPQKLGEFFEKRGTEMGNWEPEAQAKFLENLFQDDAARGPFLDGLDKCVKSKKGTPAHTHATSFLSQLGISYQDGEGANYGPKEARHKIDFDEGAQKFRVTPEHSAPAAPTAVASTPNGSLQRPGSALASPPATPPTTESVSTTNTEYIEKCKEFFVELGKKMVTWVPKDQAAFLKKLFQDDTARIAFVDGLNLLLKDPGGSQTATSFLNECGISYQDGNGKNYGLKDAQHRIEYNTSTEQWALTRNRLG